jgi:hypothetical protein
MLHGLKQLRGYTASATDGDIGQVEDFLFDDERWTIRYLVVETGGFLERVRVLISPISFEYVDWPAERFRLSLTMRQVESSPSIDADKPVSRQREREFSGYYGYPYYWGAGGVWGAGFYPGMLAPAMLADPVPEGVVEERERAQQDTDVHLRSARHVRSYHIQGRDDSIGHVEDFLIDDATWQIRYLVVDTRNWWFGKKILLPPEWARQISWEERRLHVDLTRAAIQSAPAWEPADRLDEQYDSRLRQHYSRAS